MRLNLIQFFILLFAIALQAFSGTVVFYEKDFPTIDNGAISRATLERSLAVLNPRFLRLEELKKENALTENDLLILPYGSAFPADVWGILQKHVERSNLLIIGGKPLNVPVYRDSNTWRIEKPQNTFSRALGIIESYAAPQRASWSIQWDDDAPLFTTGVLNPKTVFVNSGFGRRYRGIGFMVDKSGNRLAAPVAADDGVTFGINYRRVYLSFDADIKFWESSDGIKLIRQAALYASLGGTRLWLDIQFLTLNPGDRISGAVDVRRRSGIPAKLLLEIVSGEKILATRTTLCGNSLHEEIGLPIPLKESGLYKVRASLSIGDTILERYTSGVFVRDTVQLKSGKRLEAGRDFFRLDGKPYVMTGSNYFCTDPYTSAFFVGGSIGGNAYVWEKDFAEMKRLGFTAVRTGIWLNRVRYLDQVSGAADERILRAIEGYLTAAGRHNLQVIFTFFAFDPQTEMQQGKGQEGNLLGAGSNPYIDPVAIEAQLAYVKAIASRFKDVPYVSWDLINEPSFNNPKRPWKGNSPNGDPVETAAYQRWLEKKYGAIEQLAAAWRVPVSELGTFNKITTPSFEDLELARSGNPRLARAIDFNLFAQEAFAKWVDTIIAAIRSTGANQIVTVGHDEGGITNRVLNQFWANSSVAYTSNHTWWRDDALLWGSFAAKTPYKPNLIGETGPQPVTSMDGTQRWHDVRGLPLAERKLALGFANANAGVLHWDWSRDELFSLLRRDGSHKVWMEAFSGMAAFANTAQSYATEAQLPEIAIVLPQSLQLSVFSSLAIEVQQNAVRALYNYARATAFAVGEYQVQNMPDAKLIIVPSPWVFNQNAWELLMKKVNAGATLLISGRIDADEHWNSIPERTKSWKIEYSFTPLITREAYVQWPGGTSRLSYPGDKTTYGERGVLGGRTFLEIPFGKGRIIYSALPLEAAVELNEVAKIYQYALRRAGVKLPYETSCKDPGILICPTQLLGELSGKPEATLYVLTSESSENVSVEFTDALSDKAFKVTIAPGRAALMLIGKNGKVVASYNGK